MVGERCDICARRTQQFMVVGRNIGGPEMTLCDECAQLAFPGLSDMMRCACPICNGEAARFN